LLSPMVFGTDTSVIDPVRADVCPERKEDLM
jgi:hypothetical protein